MGVIASEEEDGVVVLGDGRCSSGGGAFQGWTESGLSGVVSQGFGAVNRCTP